MTTSADTQERESDNMIEQEKMIVEALPSLYPLQKFEEDAIHAVIDALPHWIPVTEGLPESKEEDLEYPTVIIDLDGQVALGCYYESTREWGMGEYFNQKCFPIAWMPLPEPYKGVMK